MPDPHPSPKLAASWVASPVLPAHLLPGSQGDSDHGGLSWNNDSHILFRPWSPKAPLLETPSGFVPVCPGRKE